MATRVDNEDLFGAATVAAMDGHGRGLVMHEAITWTQVHPDGSEETRSGWVWSPAPAIGGSRTYWVLPDQPQDGERPAIAVIACSRRRRCGAVRKSVRAPERYDPKGGRWFDKGDHYSETDPRSLTGAVSRIVSVQPGARDPLQLITQARRIPDEPIDMIVWARAVDLHAARQRSQQAITTTAIAPSDRTDHEGAIT